MTALVDTIAAALADLDEDAAAAECSAWLDSLTIAELAALLYDWSHTWARETQIIPQGRWRSYGFLTARRVGKTRSISEFVSREAMAGRAMRIGFCAQNFDKALEVQVYGDAGLIAVSPPGFRARFESGRVIWPNGAQAFPFTPEVPGAIRGPGVHLFWASELQSWPIIHRDEAWHNASLMTSLGYAKTVWDATPKRRHPLIRMLLERAEADPALHRVIRGTIWENADNLAEGVIEDLEKAMGGTRRGAEELEGVYRDQDDDCVFQSAWFDRTRRQTPSTFKRRIISIDPATTSDPRSSDSTGIVCMGLGVDDQLYATGNLTGVHRAEVWPALAVARYVQDRCDCLVVETNKGGDAVLALINIAARDRGLNYVKLGPTEKPSARPGVVYVRPVHTRGTKAERAEAAASLCERGQVSLVTDADLGDLEDRLCDFTGEGREKDDAVDAFSAGCFELGALTAERRASPMTGLAMVNQHTAASTLRKNDPGYLNALNTDAQFRKERALVAAAWRKGPGGWNSI